jgi:hypothetical protein
METMNTTSTSHLPLLSKFDNLPLLFTLVKRDDHCKFAFRIDKQEAQRILQKAWQDAELFVEDGYFDVRYDSDGSWFYLNRKDAFTDNLIDVIVEDGVAVFASYDFNDYALHVYESGAVEFVIDTRPKPWIDSKDS